MDQRLHLLVVNLKIRAIWIHRALANAVFQIVFNLRQPGSAERLFSGVTTRATSLLAGGGIPEKILTFVVRIVAMWIDTGR
jgi:hypothetical protein